MLWSAGILQEYAVENGCVTDVSITTREWI
jgi:hypothetical protein